MEEESGPAKQLKKEYYIDAKQQGTANKTRKQKDALESETYNDMSLSCHYNASKYQQLPREKDQDNQHEDHQLMILQKRPIST